MSTPEKEYGTPSQWAEFLQCTADKIRDLINTGQLEAIDASVGRGKHRWIISSEAIDKFLRSRSTRATATPKPTRRRRRQDHIIEFY